MCRILYYIVPAVHEKPRNRRTYIFVHNSISMNLWIDHGECSTFRRGSSSIAGIIMLRRYYTHTVPYVAVNDLMV